MRPGSAPPDVGLEAPKALHVDRGRILDAALLAMNVIPVDPRDFLRGDYVVLSYGLSRLSSDLIEGGEAFSVDQTVYVALRQDGFA